VGNKHSRVSKNVILAGTSGEANANTKPDDHQRAFYVPPVRWKVGGPVGQGIFISIEEFIDRIAVAYGPENAGLIGAAPDLLTAAKQAKALIEGELNILLGSYCPHPVDGVYDESGMNQFESGEVARFRSAIDVLATAIRKAEGK
jgi:hypothetical protein